MKKQTKKQSVSAVWRLADEAFQAARKSRRILEDPPEHRSTENGCSQDCRSCAIERVKQKRKARRQLGLVSQLAELSTVFMECKRYKQGDGLCCACTDALFQTFIYFEVLT